MYHSCKHNSKRPSYYFLGLVTSLLISSCSVILIQFQTLPITANHHKSFPSVERSHPVKRRVVYRTYCLLPLASRTSPDKSSGATALQGFGRQSGRRRSAKLVPTFADKGVSRGQRNGSPRPLISVYRTWIANYFIQVAPQLTSRGSVHPVPDPLPLRKIW